jgi:hypothetical protein
MFQWHRFQAGNTSRVSFSITLEHYEYGNLFSIFFARFCGSDDKTTRGNRSLINDVKVGTLKTHWPNGAPKTNGEKLTITKKFGEWSLADLQLDGGEKVGNSDKKEETSD